MKEVSNPFAEIKKVPLFGDTLQSSAYSVHLKNELNYEKPWNEVGIVSKDYMLVNNKEITNMVESIIDHSDIDFALDKTFFNGKQFMRCYKATEEIDAEVKVGDNLGIGVMVSNSYDGSTSGRFSIFAYRLLCKNGMMAKRMFQSYRFKHSKENENWAEEMESAAEIIKHAGTNVKEFAGICSKLTTDSININDMGYIRKKFIPKIPTSTFGKVVDQIYNDEYYSKNQDITSWDLLNAGTHVLWHKEKQTVADFNNNDYLTTGFLEYAKTMNVPTEPIAMY
jgi:hypothetical protein